MNKYMRSSLEVEAVQYEIGKGIEDGFELWTTVITNGWVNSEDLVQVTRPNTASTVCPFIRNKRGITFIRNGDYIITESDGERHVCSASKFPDRFKLIED